MTESKNDNNKKHVKQKIKYWSKELECDKNNIAAYFFRGIFYYESKNYKKAIEDLSKVIKLVPDNSVAYFKRGLSYYKLKDYKKAIKDFSKLIELYPNNSVAYFKRAEAYLKLGKLEKAIEDCSSGVICRLDEPDLKENKDYYLNLILEYIRTGNFKKVHDILYRKNKKENNSD